MIIASRNTLYIIFALSPFYLFSQQSQTPIVIEYEANLSKISSLKNNFHEGIQPYLQSELKQTINIDSINESISLFNKKNDSSKFSNLSILPLINLSTGYEKSNTSGALFTSGIGATLNYNVKDKLFFNAYYKNDLQRVPYYISNYAIENQVIPQEGITYSNGNNINTRNFGGYLSYSPNDIFNFQVGQGKNHWGNGYRSLLLSDASNNYLYGKLTTTIWKVKYVNLYTNFKDVGNMDNLPYWQYDNKFGTFHYLSWNATKRINFSFFESIIWQGKDTVVNRGFDPNYLNPVIFYRPIEYSVGSSDNSLMGLNMRYKVSDNILVYGQLVMDEFLLKEVRSDFIVNAKKLLGKEIDPTTKYGWWANKQGFQLGVKWNNILIPNLNMRLEYNTVRPYTYSHISGLSNYGHFNQPLAHPYGANFKEGIWIINYQKDHFNINLENIYAIRGLDTKSTNYGNNIFKSYTTREQEYYNFTGQGITSKMIYTDLKLSYIIKPENMLHAFIGITNRIEKLPAQNLNTTFIYLGIKTSLFNSYRDF